MRSSWKACVFGLVMVALALPLAAAVHEALPERASGAFDPAQAAWQQAQLHAWLVAERAAGAERGAFVVRVDRAELRAIAETADGTRKLLVGVTRPVGATVELTSAPRHGALREVADGFVWTGVARSEGAQAIRVHVTGLDLPAGAELYVYNDEGQAFGPYTGQGPNGSGDFWTNAVAGDLAYLQLRHRGVATPDAIGAFQVADIGHLDPSLGAPEAREMATTGFCSFNASCVVDRNCASGEPAFVDGQLQYGIAHYQFVSGAYIYICSGGLLADTVTTSQIPYFLTANHCLSRSTEASSVEAYFQFSTSQCGGACYDPTGVAPRVLGASITATNKTGDFTLLTLAQAAPAGSYFLGWSSTPIAFTDGADLYRVSHPKGAPQAYSHHQVDTAKGTCTSWPRGSWIYEQDIEGATEGGSSGSPVVNASGQVVGQLSGACGTNVNDVCDSTRNATVDGAFASYYTQVQPYLSPGGGGGSDVITLSASGYIVKNKRKVDLTWSGSTATSVDVYRNSAKLTTTPNDGAYTDSPRSAGTYTYKVCNAGTQVCSNNATVTF